MTTNLHDKMLKAIDAYFSASNEIEAHIAEEQLLDVRDEINKYKLAEQPAQPLEPVQCWKCGDMDPAFYSKCDVPACGMKEGKTP